jgi:prevent-host-death family protein
MSTVNLRELRNHGGDVLDRVARGERVTVTRSGEPIAELHPLASPKLSAAALVTRWRLLPRVDPVAFLADVDATLNGSV